MLIRSIELQNFRQYKGTQKIEFSTEKDKPVTIVLGRNTGGKTTLVRAFAWCLYGGSAEKLGFAKKSSLLNEEVMVDLENHVKSHRYDKKTSVVSVTLTIETDDRIDLDNTDQESETITEPSVYTIQRSIRYFTTTEMKAPVRAAEEDFSIFVRQGVHNQIEITGGKKQAQVINRLLPEDLSEYFFFWGEKIENLSLKRELNNAIIKFTHLNVYSDIEYHLKQIKNAYAREAASFSSNDDVKKLSEHRTALEKELRSNKAKLTEYKKSEVYFKEQLQNFDQQLYRITDDEKTQKEIKRYRLLIKKTEDSITKDQTNFIKRFNNPKISQYIVLTPAADALSSLDTEGKNKSWSSVTADMIHEILKKGVCICGKEIKDDKEAIDHLQEELDYVVPNSLNGKIGVLKANINSLNSNIPDTMDLLKEKYTSLEDNQTDLISYNSNLDALLQIQTNSSEINRIKEGHKLAQERLSDCQKKIGRTEALIDNTKKDLASCDKQLQAAIATEKRLAYLMEKIDITQALLNQVTDKTQVLKKGIRDELKTYTQEYLDQMYAGKREIEISDTFNISIYNMVDGVKRQTETSPGLETVKNFAFIAALLTLAQKRRAKSDELNFEDRYPLVLDAPFSQTDESHILEICKLLIKISPQTILVMMEKDWEIASRVLGAEVGKSYVINKKSETYSVIKKEAEN